MGMMKLTVLLGLIVLASSKGVKHSKLECSVKGPKYWCESLDAAEQCHAVSYCKEHVWSKNQLESAKTSMCTYCEENVKILHNMVKNPTTQTYILYGLGMICQCLQPAYQKTCTDAVTTYGKTIVGDLVNYTKDATKSCQMIHLCPSGNSKQLKQGTMPWLLKLRKAANTDSCTYCQEFFGTLHVILANNETQAQILKEVCTLVPAAYKSMCTIVVDTYGPQLIKEVVDYLQDPRKICKLLHICPSGKNEVKLSVTMLKKFMAEKVNRDYCLSCKENIKTFHSHTSTEETKSSLVQSLKNMCEFLPKGIAYCHVIMSTSDEMIDSILEYTKDSGQFCTDVGFCKNSDVTHKVNVIKPVETPDYIKFVPSEGQAQLVKPVKEVSDAPAKCQEEAKGPTIPGRFIPQCDDAGNYKRKQCHGSTGHCWCVVSLTGAEVPGSRKGPTEEDPNCDSGVNGAITCEVCTYAMGYLENWLGSNNSEAAIKEGLDKLCDHLPESVQASCTNLVNQYTDEIVKLIILELKPDEICKELKLCTSSQKAVAKLSATNFGITCGKCESGLYIVYLMLNDKTTQEKMKETVTSLCSMIKSKEVKETCTNVVNNYFDEFMKIIVDEAKNPIPICKALQCTASANKLTTANLPASGEICQICVYAAGTLSTFLKNNATKDDAKKEILALCNYAPSSLVAECKSVVGKYFDFAYAMIVSRLEDPNAFCKDLHLCASTNTVSTPKVASGVYCEICEYAAHYASGLVNNATIKADIEKDILKLCDYAPSSLAAECKTMVDKYFDIIYELIVAQLADPENFCTEIGMCTSNVKVLKKSPANNVVTCEICELAMEQLDNILKGSKVKEDVEAALDKLCSIVPYQAKCIALVNQYSVKIINAIVNELKDPKDVCTEIGLCTSNVKVLKKSPANSIVTCEICELALEQLDNILKGNKTKEGVKAALDKLCSIVPYKAKCISLVNQYSDKIINAIVNELKDPKDVCTFIGLCSASKQLKKEVKNGFTCEFCEIAMKKLDELLNSSSGRSDVTNALEKLCNYLPGFMAEECTSFVNSEAPKIIDLIVNKLKAPATVCKELHLCSSKKVVIMKVTPKNNVYTCELCKFVMMEVENMLGSKRTKEAVIKVLDNVCDKLPTSIETECTNLVTEFAPSLIKYIVEEMKDPSKFCQEIRLCTENLHKNGLRQKKLIHKTSIQRKDAVDPSSCQLCMFVSGKLDVHIKQSSTVTEIKKILMSECSNARLSGDRRFECQRLVEEYEDMITILAKKGKLSSLCRKIGMCYPIRPRLTMPAMRVANSGRYCMICEYAVGVLDSYIEKNSTKALIVGEIHSLCNKLPNQAFIVECNALIGQYGNSWIQMFVDKVMEPIDVCKRFAIC